MKKHILLGLLASTLALPASAAFATTTIDVTNVSFLGNAVATLTANGGYSKRVHLGQMFISADVNGVAIVPFGAYCLNILKSIKIGAQTPALAYNGATFSKTFDGLALSPAAAHETAWLYNTYGQGMAASAAAGQDLQAAAWQVEFQGIHADFDVGNAAQQARIDALTALAETHATYAGSLSAFISADGKTQPITGGGGGGGGGGGVPEPATWTMMILGIGGVGALMRRRRGAQSAIA